MSDSLKDDKKLFKHILHSILLQITDFIQFWKLFYHSPTHWNGTLYTILCEFHTKSSRIECMEWNGMKWKLNECDKIEATLSWNGTQKNIWQPFHICNIPNCGYVSNKMLFFFFQIHFIIKHLNYFDWNMRTANSQIAKQSAPNVSVMRGK